MVAQKKNRANITMLTFKVKRNDEQCCGAGVYWDDRNLGDIYFDRQSKTCAVRFYGWPVGIPLVDIEKICAELKQFENALQE